MKQLGGTAAPATLEADRSKTGSKTPAPDMGLIERRLEVAEADYKARLAKGKKS
jgi:hypothetical protein